MKWMRYSLVMTLLVILLGGCQTAQKNYMIVEAPMLGTRMRIVADLEGVAQQEVFRRAMDLDREMKQSMSIFEEDSRLNRINKNLTDTVDRHIVFNLDLARQISELSEGRYDVTVKPLVEAWGFAGKHRLADPNVDSLKEFVGMDKVSIREGRLMKTDPRVQLDFNSIAKGYTVDLLAELVHEMGAENYIVDIGGEIRCKGVNAKGCAWRIGVETPFEGNMTDGEYLQKRLQLSDGGMATSGNYRRFYTNERGEKVTHTLDPRTGRSVVSRLLSVTVVAQTCAEADALGTMFMAMGADDALKKVAQMPDMAVYFILAGDGDEYEEYISPRMQKLIMQ